MWSCDYWKDRRGEGYIGCVGKLYMETDQILSIMIGLAFIFTGISFAYLKVDKEELQKTNRLLPGISLLKFGWWRWSLVVIGFVAGTILLGNGFNLIQL